MAEFCTVNAIPYRAANSAALSTSCVEKMIENKMGDNPPNAYDKRGDAFARDQKLFSRTLTILLRFCFARGIAIPYDPLAADILCPKANYIFHIVHTLHCFFLPFSFRLDKADRAGSVHS